MITAQLGTSRIHIVRQLLEYGADLNVKDQVSPIHNDYDV
jgi:hypothetical protein